MGDRTVVFFFFFFFKEIVMLLSLEDSREGLSVCDLLSHKGSIWLRSIMSLSQCWKSFGLNILESPSG